MLDERSVSISPGRRYMSLLQRLAGLNAVLLVLAVGATITVLDPRRVSALRVDGEAVVLTIVVVAAILLNVYLARRILAPIQTLTAVARRADLTGEGERMPLMEVRSEVGELASAFNEMLDRMATERRESAGRILAAQEAERLRIAQELHDQIGQDMTAMLLSLARVESRAAAELKRDVAEVQQAVRASLEAVRQIAIELRPEALDDLGLESALAVLCERFAERTGVQINEHIDPELPALSPEIELVLYRVTQEALTNVARHSGADAAELNLGYGEGRLTLTVSDHGRGLPANCAPGGGMRGMRERVALIGGHLTVEPESAGKGCRVTLTLMLDAHE